MRGVAETSASDKRLLRKHNDGSMKALCRSKRYVRGDRATSGSYIKMYLESVMGST